jgi:hypothetical protein
MSSGEAGVIGLFVVTFGLKITVFYFVLAMGRALIAGYFCHFIF